jgi:hypothetical protein
MMGGTIWAESIPGKGSRFSFTIETEVVDEPANSGMPAQTAYERIADKMPLRILVAEDVPSNQKVIVEMLKRMGYGAEVAYKEGGESCVGGRKEMFDFRHAILRQLPTYIVYGPAFFQLAADL